MQAFPDLDFITMRHYAADRRPFFLEYEKATGLPKEICKKSMASIMFGAHNFGITEKRFDRLWRTPEHQTALHEKGIHNREDLICVLSQLDFLRGAQEDMVTVSNAMNERYPELITMLKAAKTAEGKTYSDGTAIHWLLSDMETECLIVIKQALQRRGYLDACGVNKDKLDCIFMYDGIQLPQRNITAGDLDAYMPDLEEAVYESTKRAGLLSNGEGLRIGFMRKPMDEYFPGYDDEAAAQLPCDVEQPEQDVQADGGEEGDTMVPDEEERRYPDMWIRAYEPRVIEDDLEAANLVIDRHYGRTIMMSDGLILTKHQQGYWMLDGTMVDRYLTALVSDSNFVKEGAKSYSGTTRGASNIRNMLIARMTKLDDPNFIKKLWWACKGKLVFEDGYWDCSLGDNGDFVDGHEGLEFVIMIHRKYPRQSNPAVKGEMMTRLIAPTFDNADFKDQLFQFKARALAGLVEDKTFALLKSPLRSSGKTIICKAIRHAFEGYVFEFTSDVLMAGQGCGDGERDSAWMLPMEFARDAVCSELKTEERVQANGKRIKDIHSNDAQRARVPFGKKSRLFNIQAILSIQCNAIPKVDPADALERCVVFPFPNVFMTPDEFKAAGPGARYNRRFKHRDDTIHDFIRRADVIDEFTLFVLEHYKRSIVEPSRMMQKEYEAVIGESGKDAFDEIFDVTGKEEDWVSSTDVDKIIKQHKELGLNKLDEFKGRLERRLLAKVVNENVQQIPFKISEHTTTYGPRKRIYRGIRIMQPVPANNQGGAASNQSDDAMVIAPQK